MGTKKFNIAANRDSIRTPVVPTQIKGLLTRAGSTEQLPFLIWDVSKSGIGLWSSGRLEAGESIKVTVGQPHLLMLDCEVRWCEEKADGEGFRCGLSVPENSAQLHSLYETFCQQMEDEINRVQKE